MKVGNKAYRTVWMEGRSVFMIDQNQLPFRFVIHECRDYRETAMAIQTMIIRGAGALGAAAGYAMAQAFLEEGANGASIDVARREIEATRPTARNLFYAVERVHEAGMSGADAARHEAEAVADRDVADSRAIGSLGNSLIPGKAMIATHCNAGWLAFVDHGTALAPVYAAHEEGKNIFVLADETRPRGQGARLTAWEMNNAGIPHAIIPDNALAHYMSRGEVDLVIVGADRIAANGDVANKIGTLEKAIAAKHYNVPFYVAAPTSTIDMHCPAGDEIIIEERDAGEVLYQVGPDEQGEMRKIRVASPGSDARNPAFDVTPAELITAIITEKGIIKPDPAAISTLC